MGPKRRESLLVRRTSCPSRACRMRSCVAVWLLYRAGPGVDGQGVRRTNRRSRCLSYEQTDTLSVIQMGLR